DFIVTVQIAILDVAGQLSEFFSLCAFTFFPGAFCDPPRHLAERLARLEIEQRGVVIGTESISAACGCPEWELSIAGKLKHLGFVKGDVESCVPLEFSYKWIAAQGNFYPGVFS